MVTVLHVCNSVSQLQHWHTATCKAATYVSLQAHHKHGCGCLSQSVHQRLKCPVTILEHTQLRANSGCMKHQPAFLERSAKWYSRGHTSNLPYCLQACVQAPWLGAPVGWLQYSAPAQLLCMQAQNSARIKENTTKHQDLKADEAPEQQIVVPEHTQRFHHRP